MSTLHLIRTIDLKIINVQLSVVIKNTKMQKYIDTIGLLKNYKHFYTCRDAKNHHHDIISKGQLPNSWQHTKIKAYLTIRLILS